MRTTHRCPKCQHDRVLYIPEPKDTDLDRLALGGVRSVWSGTPNLPLEAYVCLRCGVVELYAKNLGDVDFAKLPAGSEVRTPVNSGSPHR